MEIYRDHEKREELRVGAAMTVLKSVYYDQEDILKAIIALHCPAGIQCDVTYGNGQFYKKVVQPSLKFDIQPQGKNVVAACSTALPLTDKTIESLMFDPPFLTYIKQGREHNSIMAKRFSGYWAYSELEAHYSKTIKEAARVLKPKGVFIVKCQDIIHNHRLHCTHNLVINWAEDNGFRIKDLFILPAKHRMPVNTKGKQQHARIFHSYFLVFEKNTK